MKRKCLGALVFVLMLSFGVGSSLIKTTYADEEGGSDSPAEAPATSISLTPVYNVMQISSDSTYTDTFEVKNDGGNKIEIEVYAAPYSYVYSENEDSYKLGFNKENNFTQITRWISFKDNGGSWSKKAKYEIDPKKLYSYDEIIKSQSIEKLYNEVIEQYIEKEGQKQYNYFISYLKKLNISKNTSIVDLGWRGTTQKILIDVLKYDIKGIYFGLTEQSEKLKNKCFPSI